jgi:hypothetical protein
VDRTKAGSSYGFYNSDIWKVIWNLKVPKSEKHFIWRTCHDILPTQDNLMRRKIVRDPLCPICGLEVETESYFIGMPLGDGCVCVCVWGQGRIWGGSRVGICPPSTPKNPLYHGKFFFFLPLLCPPSTMIMPSTLMLKLYYAL